MKPKDLVKQYFGIKELVCPDVYERFGESAWQFLDARLLHTLYVIREMIDRPVIVNNWAKGGSYSQRGLRCNVCPLVKEKTSLEKVYLSAHVQGVAVDFHVPGMTTAEVRRLIIDNQRLLPYPIRIERDTTTWIHIDMRNDDENFKIVEFYA